MWEAGWPGEVRGVQLVGGLPCPRLDVLRWRADGFLVGVSCPWSGLGCHPWNVYMGDREGSPTQLSRRVAGPSGIPRAIAKIDPGVAVVGLQVYLWRISRRVSVHPSRRVG